MNDSDLNPQTRRPKFEFVLPAGYDWLIERRLVSFHENGQLQPWYFLSADDVFSVTEKWKHPQTHDCNLVAFARRQDCDDIACFCIKDGLVHQILLVHGWTENGFDVVAEYDSFWDWLKEVIDDIAEWVDLADDSTED